MSENRSEDERNVSLLRRILAFLDRLTERVRRLGIAAAGAGLVVWLILAADVLGWDDSVDLVLWAIVLAVPPVVLLYASSRLSEAIAVVDRLLRSPELLRSEAAALADAARQVRLARRQGTWAALKAIRRAVRTARASRRLVEVEAAFQVISGGWLVIGLVLGVPAAVIEILAAVVALVSLAL